MDSERRKENGRDEKGIWSPSAVALFCFFFTFLAAGLMNAISYGRAGYPEKKNKRFLVVIPGFIVFIILASVTPDGWSPLFTLFNLGMILYFRYDQKKLFDEYVAKGGKKAGVGFPLLICLSVTLLLLMAMLASAF
ncbi:hypothetical protein C8P63_10323 [Melghirimyces profundicolus]|uniref:Uncharacterized protein n=1 Tax=Melghirimyces profundicolus TaxID=1242148 RepID=A0A2T6C7D4_9BACL|nr:hypothetical protein [Melghirimyces profundicolus]PTX64241.1 hypothetical protein C8P63_10323 [Melghirimyces profundicolus]